MNTTPDHNNDRLDGLYEVREELKLIAESDVPYSKDAQNFLKALRREGYDV
ncbi:hypothetical protein NDI86_21830 [Halomicroarcula sp. S3CR25-11]|uniref:CopG family transcriptional regulator n=1 Tax=Haloarcula onubensis TaxID=2950539 RepID=A0ABU2FVF1_9EURY|nr:hypothetical protein [Halomicroarcula sp. S3CR25-11]MDS0284746.1 hypothetical protein [Halomicroarcula sp. S3CR25-11]